MNNWFLHSKFKLACAAFLAGLGLLIAHMLTSEHVGELHHMDAGPVLRL